MGKLFSNIPLYNMDYDSEKPVSMNLNPKCQQIDNYTHPEKFFCGESKNQSLVNVS